VSKLVWLSAVFLGIVCAALWRGAVFAQDGLWETCLHAAGKAQRQGRTAEAARLYQVAIRRAERFGPQDPRLMTSLADLAALYRAQGDDQKAEPLYQRALAIGEKALGPNDPTVVACTQSYLAMRDSGKRSAPAKVERRAPAAHAVSNGKPILE
jgi:tetratricopeptide (TPR) repeat protein